MTNAILEMVSILKGIVIKGDERISVIIKSFSRREQSHVAFLGFRKRIAESCLREKGVFSYCRRKASSLNLSKSHVTRA
jgi:hypothetical protein